MGFFRKMFGKDEEVPTTHTPAPVPPSPASGIAYDPDLIDSLRNDHARLGAIFERIGKLNQSGEYAEISNQLARFKSSLQAHILTENVRFYVYLEKMLSGDPDNASTIHEFRYDMNTIARKVVEFVKHYQTSEFATDVERRQFSNDYQKVGVLLEQRLDSEEKDLYPLYRSP